MEYESIKTAEEYINLVKRYSWLVDSELEKVEKTIAKNVKAVEIQSLPKLISLVNVIGYLRGQDGAFLEARPDNVANFQKELYANEDAFEHRLDKIIGIISTDPDHAEKYRSILEQYYVRARTKK